MWRVYIYIPGSSNGLQFLPFQTNLPGGGVGQKICLRAEFSFNNRKHCNAVFLGKMNSGGIARDSGGNTRDSGVNGRNDFFENTKIIFWLKWVRAEFGALGGILRFGQISWLNAFRLKLLTARRSRSASRVPRLLLWRWCRTPLWFASHSWRRN